MHHYVHQFDTDLLLQEWVDSCEIFDPRKVLVQIFSGVVEEEALRQLAKLLHAKLPHATIVGATTSGEILNGVMHDNSILISMSAFEKTQLKSIHLIEGESWKMGCDIANKIIDDDTKCILMFADGLGCNGEYLLGGINQSVSHEIVIAGGMAADNGVFSKTYCLHGGDVFQRGVVAVALSNPELEVFHTYNLSWRPIGQKMVVTKASGNVVFEIDHHPIKEIYAKYLGEAIVKKMPASTIEFPLILQSGGIDIARSMIALVDNGGIMYAGEMPEGVEVRFGIGSPSLIRESIQDMYLNAAEKIIEGMFVYSCSARKHLLQKDLEVEFDPLAQLAPLAGFFTYGEFYRGLDENKFLNVTTTVLGLSEVKQKREQVPFNIKGYLDASSTINALIHLVEVTIKENEQSKQRYKSIIQSEPECVKVVDPRGKLVEMNAAGLGMLEADSLEAAQAMGLSDFLIPEGRAAFFDLHSKVMNGENGILEFEVKGLKGTRRWLETHATPLRDDEGNVTALLGVTRDITQKKYSDKLLKESEQFFKTVFSSAHEGIVILENNTVMDCNILASQIYEWAREEMIGRDIIELSSCYGTEDNTLETNLAMAYGLEVQVVESVFTLYRSENTKKVLKVSISSFGNESNKLMLILHDITKSIEDEKVFRMQARQAQMGEMISMIAHQWRQPLSVINSISANLKFQEQMKDDGNGELIAELEAIEEQTVHLSQTISDFRDFFRPDKPRERVKLSEIVNHGIKLVEESFKNNSIQYELIVQTDSEIKTFRNELLQVLMTMFKNTIDAFVGSTIERRFMVVVLSQDEAYATISIQDNAGGIDPTVLDKIFLPYFTTKHSSTGTGLGLYMSKMIIEEHCKGVLEVTSENKETIFKIKLKLNEK